MRLKLFASILPIIQSEYAIYKYPVDQVSQTQDIVKIEGNSFAHVLEKAHGEKPPLVTSEQLKLLLERAREPASANAGYYEAYQNSTTIFEYYNNLFTDTKMKTEVIGKTFENKDIWLYSWINGADKDNIVINCGVHAREWIAHSSCQYFTENFVKNEEFSELRKNINLYLLPIQNIDGYDYTWQVDDEEHRLWRKNRNPNSEVENPENCYGIDLNRNYDARWNTEGTSQDPCSIVYCGKEATSELEAKVLSKLIVEKRPILYVDVHSYSQAILFPWGYTHDYPTTKEWLQGCGDSGSDSAFEVENVRYNVDSVGNGLYLNSGASRDWAYDTGVKLSYTIELRDNGTYGFVLPADQIIPTGQELTKALKSMIEYAVLNRDSIPWDFGESTTDSGPITESASSFIEYKILGMFFVFSLVF